MLKDNKKQVTQSSQTTCSVPHRDPCARHKAGLTLTDSGYIVDNCGLQANITVEAKRLGDYRQAEVVTDFGSG